MSGCGTACTDSGIDFLIIVGGIRAISIISASNSDSLGIELVGAALANDPKKPDDLTYETVTDAQNKSLQWLVAELEMTLGIATTEVFRHPTVSRKNASEASTAKW